MSRIMTFDGTSCEALGLKLLRDSVVWTPAAHKGGYIDVPGGSEPVNFSEFVTGHAEYAVGGEGESASFLVSPPLAGLPDTLSNRSRLIRSAKRRLHGKTVELSDSYHPEYSVPAVCSVEVDEQREYATITVTWERDPVRLMEPGGVTVPVAWEQAAFDPSSNLLLFLDNHPDVDVSMCGWDYAEVEEKPGRGPSAAHAGVETVCVYEPYGFTESYTSVTGYGMYKGILYAVYPADDLVAEEMAQPLCRMACNTTRSMVLDDADYAAFREHVGADAYIDASAIGGWPDAGAYSYAAPDDGTGRMRGIDGDYAFSEPVMARRGTALEPSPVEVEVSGYLAEQLLFEYAPAYGDIRFDYSGYYRWVEPGEKPFPGDYSAWSTLGSVTWEGVDGALTWLDSRHGMASVPSPFLVLEPSEYPWWDDRPLSQAAWRYRLLPEDSLFVSAGSGDVLAVAGVASGHVTDAETGSIEDCHTVRYYLGRSGDDGDTWFAAASEERATYLDRDIAEVDSDLQIGAVRMLMDEVGADSYVVPRRLMTVYTDDGADYRPYGSVDGEPASWSARDDFYVWDAGGAYMRPCSAGDSFEAGMVYRGAASSGDDGTSARQDDWDPEAWPLVAVPPEFRAAYGDAMGDVGEARGAFYVGDTWADHRIYTASGEPHAVPSGISPTYAAGFFRATFPDFDRDAVEDVDTGYPFCVEAESNYPATLSKDGLSVTVRGGLVQTDLPMEDGLNTLHVNVPYGEVDDGYGSPAAPEMGLSWKRGDL